MSIFPVEDDWKIPVTEIGTEKEGNTLSFWEIVKDPHFDPGKIKQVELTGLKKDGEEVLETKYRVVDMDYRGQLLTIQENEKKPLSIYFDGVHFTGWGYL